jgi:hypothetical protein
MRWEKGAHHHQVVLAQRLAGVVLPDRSGILALLPY